MIGLWVTIIESLITTWQCKCDTTVINTNVHVSRDQMETDKFDTGRLSNISVFIRLMTYTHLLNCLHLPVQ